MQREFKEDDDKVTNEKLIALLKAVPVRDLISNAILAREKAYAPYSEFAVGAALLTKDGKTYQGANIENASYGATICAERNAFFRAVNDGVRNFKAIAIVGSKMGRRVDEFAFPCGICRQVMMEFCDPESFVIIVAKSETDYKVYLLKELLPEGFGPSTVKRS